MTTESEAFSPMMNLTSSYKGYGQSFCRDLAMSGASGNPTILQSESPEEHMQPLLEFFDSLKHQFGDDQNAIKIIDREIRRRANGLTKTRRRSLREPLANWERSRRQKAAQHAQHL